MRALHEAIDGVHRYPDGASFALRARLAAQIDVSEDQLVFGCGADELLELLAKTLIGEGDEVVFAWPSFAMYPLVVKGMGGTPVQVSLDESFVHDLPAMAAAVNERTKLVIVCNPNNPTGTSVGARAFDRFVESLPADVVLCVDEAYVEYARRSDFPDSVAWARRRPGTIVLRTFSKIFGLAGMRVGYGIADRELASYLERARHPFNVNRLAEVAALAALDDREHVRRTRELNAEGAERLEREFAELGIGTWPTGANFLLARTGPAAYAALLRQGVIVRPLSGFGLHDFVRVTIGTPEENERLVKALRTLQEAGS
jgi:histidinol-phosphate aminotransferase